jgi:FkbH-like protein
LKEKILQLLAESLNRDPAEIMRLSEDSDLRAEGLESLAYIRFIVKAEEAFDIEINDSDLLLEDSMPLSFILDMIGKYIAPSGEKPVKKCLILDCDNVLWNGIAGEDELRDIFIGDEAFALQALAAELYEKGVLICLCSKNEPESVEEVFRHFPDMPLKPHMIAARRINRSNKAENLLSIADELNLYPDSFVFLDDSDYELGLVSSLLPGVETIKAGIGKTGVVERVSGLFPVTDAGGGRNRTEQYRQQKEREKIRLSSASVDEYNDSLKTRIDCHKALPSQARRLSELSMRTNQFNLASSRYTPDEIAALLENRDYLVAALSVSDIYGDMGIVGCAVVRLFEKSALIEGFMLSCRAFGRGFENGLLEFIKSSIGSRSLSGIYRPTEKNRKFARFYMENGVLSDEL